MNRKIQFSFPVFHREAGQTKPASPLDSEGFDALKTMDETALRELGLQPWNKPNDPEDGDIFDGKALFLFPPICG